jgi:hypothetical protein
MALQLHEERRQQLPGTVPQVSRTELNLGSATCRWVSMNPSLAPQSCTQTTLSRASHLGPSGKVSM